MPFNATTYRANKYRRDAWQELARARDIKARSLRGEAHEWEIARIPTLVKLARIAMKLHVNLKRLVKLGA
jgi:hypothetical protein